MVPGRVKGSTVGDLCHLPNNIKHSDGIRIAYIQTKMGLILINDLATLISIVDFNTYPKPQLVFFCGSKGGKFNNDGLFLSCFMS